MDFHFSLVSNDGPDTRSFLILQLNWLLQLPCQKPILRTTGTKWLMRWGGDHERKRQELMPDGTFLYDVHGSRRQNMWKTEGLKEPPERQQGLEIMAGHGYEGKPLLSLRGVTELKVRHWLNWLNLRIWQLLHWWSDFGKKPEHSDRPKWSYGSHVTSLSIRFSICEMGGLCLVWGSSTWAMNLLRNNRDYDLYTSIKCVSCLVTLPFKTLLSFKKWSDIHWFVASSRQFQKSCSALSKVLITALVHHKISIKLLRLLSIILFYDFLQDVKCNRLREAVH